MELLFRELLLEQQQEYLALLSGAPQLASDYSFINLWSWRNQYGLTWAWEKDLVWLRQSSEESVYWAPVGNWDRIDWKQRLASFPGPARFIRVPEKLAFVWRAAAPGLVELREAREHWDYVYSTEELIELPGPRFAKKRTLLQEFESRYDYRYVELDQSNIEQALALQADWCVWRDCESSNTLQEENKAILQAFCDWGGLRNICGGGLEINGTMIAYTVAEPLSNDNLVIHFEKACSKHVGAYQAINNLFLANSGVRCRWVNREQDLGEDGLRKSKLSYNPVRFIKKYEVLVGAES